jgi:hypothetical protein
VNACFGVGADAEAYKLSLRRSFVVSADVAHAVHPNYAAKHEANHGPLLNKGTVIKTNNNQRYATSVRARPPAAPPRAENKTREAPPPPPPSLCINWTTPRTERTRLVLPPHPSPFGADRSRPAS